MRQGLDVTTAVLRAASSALTFGLIGIVGGPIGVIVGAFVGAILGGVHGWALVSARCYPATTRGWVLLIVDHTWSLVNTTIGSIYLLFNLMFGNRLDRSRSRSRTSLVLRNGIFGGFATTLGPVEAGTNSSIAKHEYIHVIQARIFGPFYMPLVGANYVLATILPYWLIYHDHKGHPIKGFGDYFMKGVYPHTWNEEWAYKVQGTPP